MSEIQSQQGQVLYEGTMLNRRDFCYKLGKIEFKTVGRERTISCTSLDGDIFIEHQLLSKDKQHLTTDHPKIGNSRHVYFPEMLHVEIKKSGTEKLTSGTAFINYEFDMPKLIKQFQELVREKRLLDTFDVTQIVSAKGKEASYQHLKLWEDRQTQSYSLSFLRNVVTINQMYLEVSLGSLNIESFNRSKGTQTVRLELGWETRSSSSPQRRPYLGSMPVDLPSKRLSGTGSIASFKMDETVRQADESESLATFMKFLLIEFTSSMDVDAFCSIVAHLQGHLSSQLSKPKPTNLTPPLYQQTSGNNHEKDFFSNQLSIMSLDHTPTYPFSSSTEFKKPAPRMSHHEYTVGWITGRPIGLKTAVFILDELHAKLPQPPQDKNAYVLGRIGHHNVVLTCLPDREIYTPGVVATQMSSTFPNISIRLIVGIGGGLSDDRNDIRLGDVVVSKPGPDNGGVDWYDFKKIAGKGKGFERISSSPAPPSQLRRIISWLEDQINPIDQQLRALANKRGFRYPGAEQDRLFRSGCVHVAGQPTCAQCDPFQIIVRPSREDRTRIHYGTITSYPNQLTIDDRTRAILRQENRVLCVDTEAAGLKHLSTSLPYIVIRGICDYADSHKNKQWQGYAAAAATVYAKQLLEHTKDLTQQQYGVEEQDFLSDSNAYGTIGYNAKPHVNRKFIVETTANTWLVADLRKYFTSRNTYSLRDAFERSPRKMPSNQPSPVYKTKYTIQWDPIGFLKDQEYKEDPAEALPIVITLTGSADNAQAMTCSQYLQQKWPSYGPQILELIQSVLRSQANVPAGSTLADGTVLTAQIQSSKLSETPIFSVEIVGTASSVVDLGELFGWIGASLRSSPYPEGLAYSRPVMEDIRVLSDHSNNKDENYIACAISFTTRLVGDSPAPNSRCWHGLFRNAVVVEGYPILQRPISPSVCGLEIPFHMMARLAHAQHVNNFSGRLFVKGFSAMLVPTDHRDNFITWHLIYNINGDRVSYLDGQFSATKNLHAQEIQTARHILGWCLEAKFLAGTADACYSVTGSRLPRPQHANCILQQASISGGQMVSGGSRFGVGYKDTPFHVSRSGYIRKLKWISRKFVILWDELDKRGWLVNGTSALLHLLRASLVYDSKDKFSSHFLFKWEEFQETSPASYNPDSAISTLLNESNRRLKIYPEKHDYVRLEDRVEYYFNVLEQMFDHQFKATGNGGTTPSSRLIPRAHLEGWDFCDLAMDRDPINPRVATLHMFGKPWVDFTRSINAITLFGRQFGNIMQPTNMTCPRWSTMPTQKYYLGVCMADLLEIIDSVEDATALPIKLTENLVWHNSSTAFEPCRCDGVSDQEHVDIVQLILPPRFSNQADQRPCVKISDSGAVIFGYNMGIQWCWKDTGYPTQVCPVKLGKRPASPITDSEYGSSSTGVASDSLQLSSPEDWPTVEDSEGENSHNRATLGYTAKHYKIGIVCALPLELLAVRALFDETHTDNPPFCAEDSNHYALGRMGRHKVVAACLPEGEYGTNSAAAVTSNLRRTFSAVKFCLMVGIGGGVPSIRHDIRLGDVVQQGFLSPPPRFVMSAISSMKSDPRQSPTPLQEYLDDIAACRKEYRYPGNKYDKLFLSQYVHDPKHETCDHCNDSHERQRPSRPDCHPHIHYGLVASGNQVMKNSELRDRWSQDCNVLCFEMEAAGIMNTLPCLVIRGICDYSDSHKNDRFQEYAAATAASYAKHLLSYVKNMIEV